MDDSIESAAAGGKATESAKEGTTLETQLEEGAAAKAVERSERETVAETPQKESAAEKKAAVEKEAAREKAEAEKAEAEKAEAEKAEGEKEAVGEKPGTAAIRIAHLSDLHIGLGFNDDLWNDLSRIVERNRPHIVLVTGDLVNSPFWWTLRRARKKLEALVEKVSSAAGADPAAAAAHTQCELVVIAGNHDVRVLGILAVTWIKWLAMMLALVVYFFAAGGLTLERRDLALHMVGWNWKLVEIAAAVAGGVWGLSLLLFRDFGGAFKAYLLGAPTHWTELRLAIYPFDSASRGARWARGKLGRRELGKAKRQCEVRTPGQEKQGRVTVPEPLYRIAVVHHHPLPIPYDKAQEAMMIMEDAGAFLSEISGMEIPLVLHGHKHHHHFSRVTINAGTTEQFEASVLAAGTATAGRREGRFGFNFNLIEIEGGNARIYPWVATGGTFKAQSAFWAHEPEDAAYRAYLAAARHWGYSAKTITSMANINADGDLRHATEVRGFKIEPGGEPLEQFPHPVKAGSQLGTIEHFEAYALAPSTAPGLRMRRDPEVSAQQQSGWIEFGRELTEHDEGLNYGWRYWGSNSYALTVEQFEQLYGKGLAPTEWDAMVLEFCPCAEFTMMVNFPPGFAMEGMPELLVNHLGNGRAAPLVAMRIRDKLFYSSELNALFVRIAYPPLGYRYTLRWRLAEETKGRGGAARNHAAGAQAAEMEEWLLESVATPTSSKVPLRTLLESVEDRARANLELGTEHEEPLDLTLMAYDARARELRVVAGTLADNDPRWKLRLKYGSGIAGLAYKRAAPVLWLKERVRSERLPFRYMPIAPTEGSTREEDIEDEVVLSMPLTHPEEPREVYAILSISSRQASSKLLQLKEDELAGQLAGFRAAAEEACFTVIRQCMLVKRSGPDVHSGH